MIKITSTNDVIIVEGDELTRHYPNNGTLVIPKNSTLLLLDEKSEMVLFKSASNYDTLFTGILGSISIEDEIVTRENIIEKFNAISNVNVGGNVDLFEVVQSLPTQNISDNKVYLVLDSNGSEGNTYVEYLYVNGQWEELGKFKVNVDLSGYALKTDILSANTDSRYTDYDVENPVLSGNTILLQNEVTDSRKYHTLGFDKTFTVSSNVLLGSRTTLYRGSNEYNCPQWDGNTIRFTYQLGKRLLTRLTIPYTYNGVKYVTHFDIDVNSSQQYTLNFGVINDERFTDYQSVKFKESEVYKSFGANETFVFKNNNDIKDYAILDNSINSTYDFLYGNNTIEITVGNFPLTSSNGELVIETPRFYILDNNVLTGGVQTENQTSEHPERLSDYIRYANDVKAYILTDKNTTFKTINGQQITGDGDIGLATKAELNTKQDTISDLQTIRSGASKGATALQSVPDTYALKSEIKTVNGTSLIGNGNIELATKSELNAKQDVITDLETIRSGASKGATALQSVPDTYALKSELPDITTKQDTLVSGTNIKTINGTSLLGSGNIEVSANVDLSNYYTKTETNSLVNPKLSQVTLTQAEYDALQTKEENVLYVISDASSADLSGYATKSELNAKQDVLVSGTNIKTVNGASLLGSGNIEVSADLSSYYTKAEIDSMIGGASQTITQINNLVG